MRRKNKNALEEKEKGHINRNFVQSYLRAYAM